MELEIIRKGRVISKQLAIAIVIISTLIILVIANLATRPGGFQGQGKTLTQRMAEDARKSNVSSPYDFYTGRSVK